MLNISQIVNRLKAKLGVRVRRLEISDEEIISLIMEESLPAFSVYFPFNTHLVLEPGKDLVPGYGNRFYLRTELGVNSITSIRPYDANIRRSHVSQMGGTAFDAMAVQANADMNSAFHVPITFHLHPPSIVEIDPMPYSTKLIVEYDTNHFDVGTLHNGYREEFLKLCEYDLKIDLLGQRKFFSSISTVFGEVELNLESLEEASDKRDELLEKFDEKHLFSSNRQKIWYG
jgi:hypothetical protein